MPRRAGRTAFVFACGSALASVRVGMLRPLLATGIRPHLVVGSSGGALNGAVAAADPGSAPDTLERLSTTARRSDVLPVRAPTVLRALAGRAPGFASAGGIRQVIERHLTVRRLEDTAIPSASSPPTWRRARRWCSTAARPSRRSWPAEDPPLGTAVRSGGDDGLPVRGGLAARAGAREGRGRPRG